jgi:hypothetical protein
MDGIINSKKYSSEYVLRFSIEYIDYILLRTSALFPPIQQLMGSSKVFKV